MKKVKITPLHFLRSMTMAAMLFAMACHETREPVLPSLSSARVQANSASFCPTPEDVKAFARSLAVAQNGQDGGERFDYAYNNQSSWQATPTTSFTSYAVAYRFQIENAIAQACRSYSRKYALAFQPPLIYDFDPQEFKNLYLNGLLTPIRQAISVDANLLATEKAIFQAFFSALDQNIIAIAQLAEDKIGCFPDISGTSGNLQNGEMPDGPVTMSWFSRVFERIVRVVATFVVPMVWRAMQFGLLGLAVCGPAAPVCLLSFGIAGAFIGFIEGYERATRGRYFCLFQPCPPPA